MSWSITLPTGASFALTAANGIKVRNAYGSGMPPVRNIVTDYALLDGGSWQRSKAQPRVLIFDMAAIGASHAGLRAVRRALINAVSHHRGELPVRIVWMPGGTEPTLYTDGYYEAGLEGGAAEQYAETRMQLRFVCPDPWFYADEMSTVVNDAQNITPLGYIASVLSGAWDDLNGGVSDAVLPPIVWDMNIGPDGRLYVAGEFDAAGGVMAHHVAAWNGITWATLGPSTGLNNTVHTMTWGVDGNLYLGGIFTDVQGGPGGTYNRIVRYNLAANTFYALGVGADSSVWGVGVGSDGEIYATGAFANIGGVAAARVAYWDGAAWNAMGTGLNAAGRCVLRGIEGNIYIGGDFGTADGVATGRIAMWDGATFSALGAGIDNGIVQALAQSRDGHIYAGGTFTLSGGDSLPYVGMFDGITWTTLGTGLNEQVLSLYVLQDDTLLCGGLFSADGAGQPLLGSALWNGYSWVSALFNASAPPLAYRVYTATEAENGQIYYGGDMAAIVASVVTVITNPGTANAFPVITVECPIQVGDPEPILLGIHNETTGHRMWFNYEMLEGETVTIDCRPGVKRMTSSFRGMAVGNNPLPGSQLAQFALAPGNNNISVFVWDAVNGPGSTTVTFTWDPAYWGIG